MAVVTKIHEMTATDMRPRTAPLKDTLPSSVAGAGADRGRRTNDPAPRSGSASWRREPWIIGPHPRRVMVKEASFCAV